MALNFPDSPTPNQVYTDTISGFSYQWDGVVWKSYSPSAASQIKILDDISGSFNGSATTFPITIDGTSFTPANSQQLRIVLGGIIQKPLADYFVSGAQIAFTTPPSAGLTFSGVSLGPAIPAVGLGSTATFYTRQSYDVTAIQNAFTVDSGYDIGYLEVYQNGVRLLSGIDYIASNGSTFTLTTPTQVGDTLEAVSYKTTEYYTLSGVLNNLSVSGNASIAGNTYITGITTVLSSLDVLGGGTFNTTGLGTFGNLSVTGTGNLTNLNVTGVSTLTNLNVTGLATFKRNDAISEGGQITFARSVDNNDAYSIDVFGTSASNARLRFIDVAAGAERATIDKAGNLIVGSGSSTGTINQRLQVTGSAYVSGVIGIGTTNPISDSSILHINGASYHGAAGDALLRLVGVGGINYVQSGINVSSGSSAALVFGTIFAGSEWARFTPSGDFGIGVNNPSSKLSVGGTITELSQGQYWNVVTQADVGIGASQIPLNQYLGQLAFLDEFGINVPQNAQTAAYTLVRADSGKHISITTGGVTVPTGVFEIGDTVMIYNNSGVSQTITQGASTTLRLAGTASTGNRTLAQYGVAILLCVAANTFVVYGTGVT